MKKIIYVMLCLFSLFSCDRELEYGSDFEFKVNNIDDTEIFIGTLKTFQLELVSEKSIVPSKEYKFSYTVINGTLNVKNGTTIYLENEKYDVILNENNIIDLDLIPNSNGQIVVDIFLSNNDGVIKKQQIIVNCTDQDFSYTFTGSVPNTNGNVNVGIPFSLNIVNTGLSANQFQIKYISSNIGTVTIGGVNVPYNSYQNIPSGTNIGYYTSSIVGTHNVTFTCIDTNGQQSQVSLIFNISASPFSLGKVSDFSVKNTLKKDFKFILTNTLTSATYQVKFTSLNPSKVFMGTTQLNMNSWINITLDPTNLYTFYYEANSDINDVLSVEIKDSYAQTQTINYNVTVFAKPIINNYNITFLRNPVSFNYPNYSCYGNTKINTINSISGGATLVKTKITIRNKLTGVYDVLEFNNALIQNTLENVSDTCQNIIGSGSCSPSSVFSGCYNKSKYAGQLYSVQIQDSDGVWSSISNGTCLVN